MRKHPLAAKSYASVAAAVQKAYPPEDDEQPVQLPKSIDASTQVALARGPRPFFQKLQQDLDKQPGGEGPLGWPSFTAATSLRCNITSDK